jgi:hypothetical protein
VLIELGLMLEILRPLLIVRPNNVCHLFANLGDAGTVGVSRRARLQRGGRHRAVAELQPELREAGPLHSQPLRLRRRPELRDGGERGAGGGGLVELPHDGREGAADGGAEVVVGPAQHVVQA